MLALLLTMFTAPAQAADVTIVGAQVWGPSGVATVLGPAPDDPEAFPAWWDEALPRLVQGYADDGYTAARAWAHVTPEGVVVEVEEGHIDRHVFRGANALGKALLTQSLTLSKGVLHAPTLDAQLALLADAHDLRGVSWEVRDGDSYVPTEVSGPQAERILVVEMAAEEPRGFTLDMSFDPVWGLIVTPGWAQPDALAKGDLLWPSVALGIPLQEYLWEVNPKLRWVYGEIDVRYRAPQVGPFDPLAVVKLRLEQRPRLDKGLEQVLVENAEVRVGFGLHESGGHPEPLFGAWFEQYAVLRELPLEGADPVAPDDVANAVRGGLTVGLSWKPPTKLVRLDVSPELLVHLDGGVSTQGEPILRFEALGRYAWRSGRGVLWMLRGRAVGVAGDRHIYDDYRVAGSYMRTFFADLYYTPAAIQGEIAVRLHIVRDLEFGMYYQESVFADRLADPEQAVVGASSSFGPAIHLLILDQFAIDVYVALGFGPRSWEDASPVGTNFSQTLYMSLGTAY